MLQIRIPLFPPSCLLNFYLHMTTKLTDCSPNPLLISYPSTVIWTAIYRISKVYLKHDLPVVGVIKDSHTLLNEDFCALSGISHRSLNWKFYFSNKIFERNSICFLFEETNNQLTVFTSINFCHSYSLKSHFLLALCIHKNNFWSPSSFLLVIF